MRRFENDGAIDRQGGWGLSARGVILYSRAALAMSIHGPQLLDNGDKAQASHCRQFGQIHFREIITGL